MNEVDNVPQSSPFNQRPFTILEHQTLSESPGKGRVTFQEDGMNPLSNTDGFEKRQPKRDGLFQDEDEIFKEDPIMGKRRIEDNPIW